MWWTKTHITWWDVHEIEAKIKFRFMYTHMCYTDHLSHCYCQLLVVNPHIYPAKSFNFSEKWYGINKLRNFKDFSRPNKEIKYFSRTLTEFKDFSRRLLKFKTFSRLYEPWIVTARQTSLRTFPVKFFSTTKSSLTIKNKGTAAPSSSSGVDLSVTRKWRDSGKSVQNRNVENKVKMEVL